MRKQTIIHAALFLAVSIIIFSCQKKITIENEEQANRPAVANAGSDQTITLPVNAINLDGSASTDPDNNNITNYLWTKISGPSSFNITNPNAVQTQVTNLGQGIYQFELKVTDAGILFSKDTVQITVMPVITIPSCNTRPEITASLVPIGSLSTGRYGLVAGTAGNKILFAGGWVPGAHSSRVDIYDYVSNSWSIAELTIPERDGMVTASVGNKVFFAGGGNNDWIDVTSRVDIYDAANNTWTIAELSQPRNYLSATTLGNQVFFAGGGIWGPLTPGSNMNYHIGTRVVDIYDNTTKTWTTANLSEGRFELTATIAGNKIYFAGGLKNIWEVSNRIDIYDQTTGTWSTDQLQEVKASPAAVAFGNKVMWAGGANTSYQSGYNSTSLVEVKDISTGVSSFDCITPKAQFKAVTKNDNIIFFTGYNNGPGNKFDIYNITTNTWSVGILPSNIHGAAIISVNNKIYVAGGNVNGTYSNQVWLLDF